MLTVIVFLSLALVHQSLGSENIDELLRKHPTWSFKVESVETAIKNALQKNSLTGHNLELTEEVLREKLRRNLPAGATHIVRKVGDPKWESDPSKVPGTFDAREKWKHCASLIGQVEDEGPCRADGPSIVSSVMSDRYCIFTNGTFKEKLSHEMLMGCGELCTAGSAQYQSWRYGTDFGIPTGGPHGSQKGCVPYTYPACDHTTYYDDYPGRKNKINECKGQMVFDHDCPKKCTNEKYKKPLDKDRVKLSTYYYTSDHEFAIRSEVYAYGPVVTNVLLYDDFLEKPNGIFQAKQGRKRLDAEKLIKIIGWGKENGTLYWLCMHTWDSWGDKVFKIPRGVYFDSMEWVTMTGTYLDIGNN
nr:PREDICTED: cathepsin B-like cysteine proteinase 4 [Bemisia tabaci]